jgi:ubiquinone/menaquinone biosynthesis C-methylase UbiE
MEAAMEQSIPRVEHRWYASVYDHLSKLDERRMAPIRDFVAGGASGRVLEIGCGTGANFAHYDWTKVEHVEASEPDPHMLKRAEAKRGALPPEAQVKLRLSRSPAEALPFPDASFDCAVVCLVLCTVFDQQRVLAELRRVVRAGGELRLVEHVAAEGTRGKVQRVVQPVYGWLNGGCQLHRHTERELQAAGFALQVVERPDFGPLWPGFVGVARIEADSRR